MWQSVKIRVERYEQVAALARLEQRSVANMVDRLIVRGLLVPGGPDEVPALGDGGDEPVRGDAPRGREKQPAENGAPLRARSDPPSPSASELADKLPGVVRASRLPSSERRITAGAAKGYCVHRVKLEAYCGKCVNGEAP